MRVAIHQPNYLPWIGYFLKLARADAFVLLDTVQFSKQSFTNRVKIKHTTGPTWLSQPVKTSGTNCSLLIKDCKFATQDWPVKHMNMLQAAYGKSPAWKDVISIIEPILLRGDQDLTEVNGSLIRAISTALDFPTKIALASELGVDADDPSRRLIEIIKALGGDAYLHGKGGVNYQDVGLFEAAGIALVPSDFVHPTYPQQWGGQFVPGLSVVDMLFNVGLESGRQLMDDLRA